jgi:hypothetical protein
MTDHVVIRLGDGVPPPPAELRVFLGRPLHRDAVIAQPAQDGCVHFDGYVAVPTGACESCADGEPADVYLLAEG